MGEVARIQDQLRRAFAGEAWHGPSVLEALAGVDAESAAARPLSGAHSIWEMVLHLAAWEDVVRRRLSGEAVTDVSDALDWPSVDTEGSAAWESSLRRLREGHRGLEEALAGLEDARLEQTVPGESDTVYTMLHGVIQHDLYHAGQIALLRKGAR